ncbi:MAG: alpha/beta hydrolase, partial [Oscillospiraceae bacterium]|nr:alpha/beta hydrolase [Oscillospiraceae bacterium]
MNMSRIRRPLILLLILTLLSLGCMGIADGIQRSWGRVDVSTVSIPYGDGESLTGKLYIPQSATAQRPAPAVLLLHGSQNDRETNAAFSIELSRRGYVVLSLDEYGHGYSSEGMASRGWTNHKLSVNYGTEEGPLQEIGGATR